MKITESTEPVTSAASTTVDNNSKVETVVGSNPPISTIVNERNYEKPVYLLIDN